MLKFVDLSSHLIEHPVGRFSLIDILPPHT